jgi:hypothetical protein
MQPACSGRSELPDYDYPTPIFVKNTFIDTPIVRPLSLDEFIYERRIQSCPVDSFGASDDESNETDHVQESRYHPAPIASTTLLKAAANDAVVAASQVVSSFCNWWSPVDASTLMAEPSSVYMQQDVSCQMPIDCFGSGATQVLCLENALGTEPELGSSELPTMGSAGHKWGTCQPCAFLYKRGCENGVHCSFCHLCDSGEKKRRRQEKIAKLREMRRAA